MHKIFVLLLFISAAKSANILGYFGTPSISHQITFQPVWRELARRGHNVTVITPDPIKDKSIKNLREIDLHDISYEIWNRHNISTLGANGALDSSNLTATMAPFLEVVETHLTHPEMQYFIKNENGEKFDLVMVEFFVPIAYPLKYVYDCPLVGIFSMPIMDIGHFFLANPSHPSISPDLNLPFGKVLSFPERFQSFLYYLFTPILMNQFIPKLTKMMEEQYGKLKPITQIESDIDMVFANVNPLLNNPRPNLPNVIEFNGIHIKNPKPLPEDLKVFLDGAKGGVIYVSFGSNIKSSNLPNDKLKLLLDTFKDLPYKILWKFEADKLENKPSNVEIRKWLPQQDILRHPNIKLFITQGGCQSLDEAMYTKTPVVVLPFFADQYGNARKVEDLGIGKYVKSSSLTPKIFKETILDVIKDPRYRNKADEVYNILTDKPVQPLEEIVWWIEYVIRHKGAEHMKSPGIKMPFYQFYMLDVTAAFLAIIGTALLLLVISFKLIFRLVCSKFCRKSSQQKKKNN